MPARRPSPDDRIRPVAVALRLAVVVGVLVLIDMGAGALIRRFADPLNVPGFMVNLTLVLLWLAYVVLLAIPFVPGTEIGISLLVAHGPVAAPFVYLGTLSGLSLAFAAGTLLSGPLSPRFLSLIGLARARAYVDEIRGMSHRQRVERLHSALPAWAGRWVLKHRALVLAVLLNLPGNSVIGGGGGIALLAGLSRTFAPLQFFLTIALATAPVPIAVYFFGTGLLQ